MEDIDVEEKRRSKRRGVKKIVADIAIGHRTACSCDLLDVSIHGLCICNVPKKMVPKFSLMRHSEFSAVISLGDNRVKVKLVPRWSTTNSDNVFATVGFEVRGQILPWSEFVRINTDLITNRRDDLWGKGGEKYLRL